jgi:hypothetical protein
MILVIIPLGVERNGPAKDQSDQRSRRDHRRSKGGADRTSNDGHVRRGARWHLLRRGTTDTHTHRRCARQDLLASSDSSQVAAALRSEHDGFGEWRGVDDQRHDPFYLEGSVTTAGVGAGFLARWLI